MNLFNEKTIMKLLLKPALFLSLTMNLTACGGDEGSTPPVPPLPPTPTAELTNIRVELISAPLNPSGLKATDVEVDKVLKYQAIGEYDDDTEADISTKVLWRVSDESIITVNNTGEVQTESLGDAEVDVSLDGISNNVQLSVVAPEEIIITPISTPLSRENEQPIPVPRGLSVNYNATIVWSSGELTQDDNNISWQLGNAAFEVKNDNPHAFRAIGDVSEQTTLQANYRELHSDQDVLIIDEAKLKSISLNVANASIQVPRGQSIDVFATGTFYGNLDNTDSSTYQADITTDVSWDSSNINAFINNEHNHFQAIGNASNTGATSQISARLIGYPEINSPALTLTVDNAELIDVAISPIDDNASGLVPKNFSISFRAIGSYQGTNTIFKEDITAEVEWLSNDSDIFKQDSQELNTFIAIGSENSRANITATEPVQEIISAPIAVTVDAGKLTSIDLNLLYYPGDVPQLQAREFNAIGTFSAGYGGNSYTRDISNKVNWVYNHDNFVSLSHNQFKAVGDVGSYDDIYVTYNQQGEIESNHHTLTITTKYASNTVVNETLTFENPPLGDNQVGVSENGEFWRVFNWQEATDYCTSLGQRLPTIAELDALDQVNLGSIEAVLGWPSTSSRYWSADVSSTSPVGHRSRSMEIGGDIYDDSDSNPSFITCVH